VEQAERARLVLEDGEHERDRRQRLLTAGQELNALQPLAGRRRDDIDAAFEWIALVEQREAGMPAAEQRAEGRLEVLLDGGKRLREARLARLVDPLDGFRRVRNRIHQVLALRRQEDVTRLELV